MADFKPQLVCFDLNKTLIRENTWYELNLAMGVTPEEDEQFLRWYDSGQVSYTEGQQMLEKIYKQRGRATKEIALQAINKYTYREGALDVVNYLKNKGLQVGLVSGSIDLVVEKVATELGIALFGAHNRLVFDNDGFFESIAHTGDDADFKVGMIKDFCSRTGIGLESVVCVGDGYNDRKIFELTGHGITFKGSEIEKLAWKTIDNLPDLKQIL